MTDLIELADNYADCRGAEDCGGDPKHTAEARTVLVDAIEALEKERDDLRSQVDSLNVGFNNCQKERDAFRDERNRLNQLWGDAQAQLAAAQTEVERLKEANSKLASSDLLQSYEATQAENAKLRDQLAAAQGQIPRDDISLVLLERLSKTLTRLGYATPEGGMEHFNAVLPHQLYNLCWGIDGVLDKIAAPIPQQPAPGIPTLDQIRAAIEDNLTCMYACTRVWEAWHVGTMSQEDFIHASETEFAEDTANAIHALFAATPQPKDLK